MKKADLLNKWGRWALVTGASSGIGEAFAHHLASLGCNLVLVARRGKTLKQLGESLKRKHSIEYMVIPTDLSAPNAYQQVMAATEELPIGLLISNAGAGRPGKFLDRSNEDLSEIMELNLHSHVWLTQHFAWKFTQAGGGGIVLTGAMGAVSGLPYMAIEAGTKAFIEAFGLSLNYEFKNTGVHCTVLVTSPTETPVLGKLGFTKESLPMQPISPQQCVQETMEALYQNKASIIPGKKFRIMNALTPKSTSKKMMGAILKKNNQL
ncbi:MAG: SDR family NAD(P)-dependent oxidoreductase [Cytophagaceae bacterium]|jgi:hypothetical protein|nr:SDR family NAD(P)-dependent oxidoreductase [Cytophagaceae bacterium]